MQKYRRECYARNREYYLEMSKKYREEHRTKVCATCNIEKPAEEFLTKVVNGKRYLRYECRLCHRERYKQTPASVASEKRRKERANGQLKVDRQNPELRAKFILMDVRTSDRKRNLDCTITVADIEDLIAGPCTYCHRSSVMMTLDRIDKSKGHILANVNTSCSLCNDWECGPRKNFKRE